MAIFIKNYSENLKCSFNFDIYKFLKYIKLWKIIKILI